MTAVITGDIINSQSEATAQWLPMLKGVLNQYGASPQRWEVYRGDSFQLQLDPQKALAASLHIKAAIKQLPTLDVRMGIGIGKQEYVADKITESNGSAFVYSGQCFEALKKQTMAIRSSSEDVNTPINLALSLALLTMDAWSATVANVIYTVFEHPDKSQNQLAELLNKSQSSISEALKRGGFDEIRQMESFYQNQMGSL